METYNNSPKPLKPRNVRNNFQYRKGPWNNYEVTQLGKSLDIHGPKWMLIGPEVGKTPVECRKKYLELLARGREYNTQVL
ncbi:hypothetical protein C1645_817645 [Glomus cerebriforme]|uniref:Uncharacterized protein n=1 Tax=Glomus cerebriforme TaxID=658196 RepID=A0A397TIA4_9GLOM|nr:hypothetical protein C1645_817645 [Glomus cerebriforme]